MEIGRKDLRAAVGLEPFDDAAARERMAARPHPGSPSRPWRDGAVLVLFYPGREGPTLVLTRRTDEVEHHRGQVSFPGGAREGEEPLLETALREAEEEVGIPRGEVEVIGELAPLRIPPSGFVVHPFVAWTDRRPDYRPDPREVAEVLEVPLALLLDGRRRAETEREWNGRRLRVPYFDVPGVGSPPLWGATAMMLSGLVERLRAVLGARPGRE